MPVDDSENNAVSTAMTRSEFGEEDTVDEYFENYTKNLVIRTVNHRLDSTSFAGSTLIWGNDVFGSWGSYSWGTTGDASFIIGNSLAGILGTSKLGTQESTPARIIENKMWVDYYEDFSNADYQDASNTSATWGTTGSATFPVNGSLTTINLGSDVQLSSTKFSVVNIDLTGSYFWLTQGSASSDGGATWTPITSGYGVDQTLSSTTGSEPVIKILDTTGSAVLTEINAYFHTSDVN